MKKSIEKTEEIKKDVVICDICGCVIEGEAKEFGGKKLCEDCFESEVVECNECGEQMWKHDAFYFDDNYLCEDC